MALDPHCTSALALGMLAFRDIQGPHQLPIRKLIPTSKAESLQESLREKATFRGLHSLFAPAASGEKNAVQGVAESVRVCGRGWQREVGDGQLRCAAYSTNSEFGRGAVQVASGICWITAIENDSDVVAFLFGEFADK